MRAEDGRYIVIMDHGSWSIDNDGGWWIAMVDGDGVIVREGQAG